MCRLPDPPTTRERLFDAAFWIVAGALIFLAITTLAHVAMLLKVELLKVELLR